MSIQSVQEELNYRQMPVYTAKEYDEMKARAEKAEAERDELKAEVERLCSYIDYLRLHEGNTLRSKTYEDWEAQQQGEGGSDGK